MLTPWRTKTPVLGAPGVSLTAYNGCCGVLPTAREPLRCVADAARRRDRTAVEHLQVAGELRAFLDLDLGVADLARHASCGVDDELLAHRQLTLELAMHFGVVHRDRALEH